MSTHDSSPHPKWLKALIDEAVSLAKRFDHAAVTPWHLLQVFIQRHPELFNPDDSAPILEALRRHLQYLPTGGEPRHPSRELDAFLHQGDPPDSPRELKRRLQPYFNHLARELPEPPLAIGLDPLLTRIYTLLNSPTPYCGLVYGPPGCGKSNLVAHLHATQALPTLRLPVAEILSPTTAANQAMATLDAAARKAVETRAVLLIDDIDLLDRAGAADPVRDLLSCLDPFLLEKKIRILATANETFVQTSSPRRILWTRRFVLIPMEPPAGETLHAVVRARLKTVQDSWGVNFTDDAVAAAVRLSGRLFPGRAPPGRVLDTLCQCASMAVRMRVTAEIVERFAALHRVSPKLRPLEAIEKELKARIVGQDHALERVIERLRISRADMDRHPERPDGVFLFLGPSGVGKTETARVLAEAMYGHRDRFLKLDMSEFMEAHTVSRILGSPPGYIGHDEPSYLARHLGGDTHALILLDEIEKAHPQVLNLFLQVFDEGVLTDAHGIRYNFQRSVFIMTSNLGNELWGRPRATLGFTGGPPAAADPDVVRCLLKILPPEFLNRVDEIVLFHPLTMEDLERIVALNLDDILERFAARYQIHCTYEQELVRRLARLNYQPAFGARHVIRNLETHVVRHLLQWVMNDRLHPGDRHHLTPDILAETPPPA